MVSQYKAFWSIPNAGPSVSTFHAIAEVPGEAQSFANAVRAMFNTIVGLIPDEVTVTFDTEVTQHNTQDGTLTGLNAVTAPAIVVGGSAGAWAAGSGGRIVWQTNVIREGRRVRGSTFLVPLSSTAYSTAGVLAGAAATTIQTAATGLLTAYATAGVEPVVWSRPIPGRPGDVSAVVNSDVSEMVATLRSRKS